VRRFLADVPALEPLRLVVGLELRGRGDVQLYRVELPGPRISKDIASDAKVRLQVTRSHFNELASDGSVRNYREAYETGQIKVTGDPNIQKLIAQVVERHEARTRTKKVR